jgi:hypothetical protein
MTRGRMVDGLAAALLCSSGALAAGDDFVSRFFGATPGKGKTFACFDRAYDAAHLAGHPKQNVRTMRLLGVADSSDPTSVDVRIGVVFRSTRTPFNTEGTRGMVHGDAGTASVSTAHCGVACDGGSIDVTLKTDGSVLVGIPDGARIWDPNTEGAPPDNHVSRKFGADDDLFRLDRAALPECVSLASDRAEKARLRRGK